MINLLRSYARKTLLLKSLYLLQQSLMLPSRLQSYTEEEICKLFPLQKKTGANLFMQTNYDKSVSRKYVGLFMGSRSPVVGSIEAASAILQGVSINRDQTKVSEKSEDPYRTLIWYFNSIRELAYSLSSRWDMESRIKLIRNVFDKQLESFSRSFRFKIVRTHLKKEILRG